MRTYLYSYGIDVSKDTLDILPLHRGDRKTPPYSKITNRPRAIRLWTEQLAKHKKAQEDIACVLEMTGCYSDYLLRILAQQGIKTIVVNPSQSAGYAQAQGIISKNDRQAARTLALMGLDMDLPI